MGLPADGSAADLSFGVEGGPCSAFGRAVKRGGDVGIDRTERTGMTRVELFELSFEISSTGMLGQRDVK